MSERKQLSNAFEITERPPFSLLEAELVARYGGIEEMSLEEGYVRFRTTTDQGYFVSVAALVSGRTELYVKDKPRMQDCSITALITVVDGAWQVSPV